MAGQRSKRSRKRRRAAAPPRAARSQRRELRAEREVIATRDRRRGERVLGTVGERPASPFGGLPVSEIAIFAGVVALIVWLVRGGTGTLVAGIAACVLGVVEVTAREHFAGYRSHTTLLAGIPAIAIAIALVSVTGERQGHAPLLAVAIPIFGILFWLLRRRFMVARQARMARPPAA